MGRWVGIVVVALLLAGCGIDEGKLTTARAAEGAPTTTTTTTAPTHSTEPSQRSSAEDLLLDQGALGTEWIEGPSSTDVPQPDCVQATPGAAALDEAQRVFVGGGTGAVLVQRAAVYGSTEQAQEALARFRRGLDACKSAVIHVDDLPMPGVGDEVEAARLQLGGESLGVPFELACVRVGARVSCLTYLAVRQEGEDQFPTLVRAAAAKLG
jgi:hypothetical protein